MKLQRSLIIFIQRLTIIGVFMMCCPKSFAEAVVSENSLKAAFIYHFISFTQWNDHSSAYYVCIPDDSALRNTVEESFKGKRINDRDILVVGRSRGCHVLVSETYSPTAKSILTIGRLGRGALFEFREIDHKIRFAVNLEKVQKSQLKISSQLLKLAILEKDS